MARPRAIRTSGIRWSAHPAAETNQMASTRKPKSRTTAIVLTAAGIALGVAALAWSIRGRKGSQADCSKVTSSGGTIAGIRYLETVRGGESNDRLPMIISFHSRGATPNGAGTFGGVSPVRIIRPTGFNKTDSGYTWFTKSSSTQPEQLTAEMRMRSAQLAKFIKAITACRPTSGKPIVTGSSEGGHVSYLLASTQPKLVGGAVALLGYLPKGLWNAGMAPTVGLHTTGDPTISYPRTKEFWDAMKVRGADLYTETFPGGHEVVSPMASAWARSVETMVERQAV